MRENGIHALPLVVDSDEAVHVIVDKIAGALLAHEAKPRMPSTESEQHTIGAIGNGK